MLCDCATDEIAKYSAELDSSFTLYEQQVCAKNLSGLLLTEFDERDLREELSANVRFHRLAMLAHMKACKQAAGNT